MCGYISQLPYILYCYICLIRTPCLLFVVEPSHITFIMISGNNRVVIFSVPRLCGGMLLRSVCAHLTLCIQDFLLSNVCVIVVSWFLPCVGYVVRRGYTYLLGSSIFPSSLLKVSSISLIHRSS